MRHFWGSVTNRLSRLLLGLGLALGTHAAQADAITEVGFFSRDDDVRLLGLSVTTPGLVSATSIGYAGGTTVGGTTIPRGGFDTALFLYSSAGVLLAQSDDGIGVPTDPTTGLASDAALSITLAAGGYILALTQFDNFALGMLSAGFSRSGDGNFTPSLSGVCPAPSFCDSSGDARTSNWAVNITGVDATPGVQPIPEPASAALVLVGLAAMLRRRRGVPETAASLS